MTSGQGLKHIFTVNSSDNFPSAVCNSECLHNILWPICRIQDLTVTLQIIVPTCNWLFFPSSQGKTALCNESGHSSPPPLLAGAPICLWYLAAAQGICPLPSVTCPLLPQCCCHFLVAFPLFRIQLVCPVQSFPNAQVVLAVDVHYFCSAPSLGAGGQKTQGKPLKLFCQFVFVCLFVYRGK